MELRELRETRRCLRIAVLAHGLRVGGGLSVGQNMIAALGHVAPEHAYLVTIPMGLGYEDICRLVPKCETVVYRHAGHLKRLYYESFEIPSIVRSFRPDVLLALGGFGLANPPCPQAVLIQDAHLFYSSKHYGKLTFESKLNVLYHKRHFRRQLKNTQLVLVQTGVVQDRLRAVYGYRGQTAISPNAVSAFAQDTGPRPAMPSPLAPYSKHTKLFFLTKYYAHKNLEILLQLYRDFGNELADVVTVTTVSPDHYAYAPLFLRSVQQMGLGNSIINVGPLKQCELAAYYRNCQAMFLPTFLESFSGTYLEAMHFGLPVLTSDLDFAHIVCGDAAIYFDPWNAASIKDAILRLRNNPELSQELVAKGETRLQTNFRSWDQIATDAVSLLEQIAGCGAKIACRRVCFSRA